MSPLPVNPSSLISRSRQDIVGRLIERLPRLTPYTYVGDGSIVRGFLEAVAQELGNVYGILSYSFSQQLVMEATGPSLDALGVLYNVRRRYVSISDTQAAFYFYIANSPNHQVGIPTGTADSSFTIPVSTIVKIRDDSIGDALSMATTSPVVFNQGDSIHYVSIRPTTSSMKTNISPNTLRYHEYDGTGSTNLYCTNPIELQVNTGLEPDEDYRARIISAVRGIASANKIALRLAGLSIDHVRDVKVIERPYGPATVKVVIALDSGADGNELALASSAINLVRPVGTYVEVLSASAIPVSIRYGATVTDTTQSPFVMRGTEAAIKSYFGSLAIGQPMRKSQLLEKMFLAAPTALDIYIMEIRINGMNFIGDVYRPQEDATFAVGTISTV